MNYVPFFRHLAKIFLELIAQKNLYPRPRFGRPRANLASVFLAILRKLLEGSSWRTLRHKHVPWRTAYGYFQEWQLAGLFEALWQKILKMCVDSNHIDRRIQVVDGSEKITRNMLATQASIGYKHKSKHAVKLTLIVTHKGLPVGLDVHGAGCSDVSRLEQSLQSRVIKPSKSHPALLLGDKGYIGESARKVATQNNSILFTPAKKNERRKNHPIISVLLKCRNIVERTFKRLYDFKRIDQALDRYISSYLGWCHLGLALLSIIQLCIK